MAVFLKGANMCADDGKAKRGPALFSERTGHRIVGPRARVPRQLQLDDLINYVPAGTGTGEPGDDDRWVPVGDDRMQAAVAYSRIRGGTVTVVGPPITGKRPDQLMSLARVRRGRPLKSGKRCPHDKRKMCNSCVSKSHGLLDVVAAKSQGELVRRKVDKFAARIPAILGYIVSRGKVVDDPSLLRTKALKAEDGVTLALALKDDPVMRDAIAVCTQGLPNLGVFREMSQAIYSMRHMLDAKQFADFLLDGVTTTRFCTVLNMPQTASLSTGQDAHRLALCYAPMSEAATEPDHPIVIGLPALVEVLRMLEVPSERRRLFISFVHNGTGNPGVTRNLESFAPAASCIPARVTIRVNQDPLTWANLCVLMRTYSVVIIEVSYFRASEVTALTVAGILLRILPENVCTDGMPVMHSALRGTPREAHALALFGVAQKHKSFAAVARGQPLPSIVVADDGHTNLSRVMRVVPLVEKIAAVLDREAPPDPSRQLATAASAHTTA